MLCSPALAGEGPSCTVPGIDLEAVDPSAYAYWNGLQAGAAIQKLEVSPSTQSQRDRAMLELTAWLAKSSCTRGLQDRIPEDIIVYLVTW